MNRYADRLNQRRMLVGQGIGQAIHNMLRNGNEFGKRPMPTILPAGNPQHTTLIAEIPMSLATKIAHTTGNHGIESYPHARRKIGHVFPNSNHLSRSFMPHDQRRDPSATATVVTMDIAAADATGGNFDQDVVGATLRIGDIGDLKLLIF